MSLPYRQPPRPVSTTRTTLPIFLAVAAAWVGSMMALFHH